jgi:hypothetical protein
MSPRPSAGEAKRATIIRFGQAKLLNQVEVAVMTSAKAQDVDVDMDVGEDVVEGADEAGMTMVNPRSLQLEMLPRKPRSIQLEMLQHLPSQKVLSTQGALTATAGLGKAPPASPMIFLKNRFFRWMTTTMLEVLPRMTSALGTERISE